MNGGVCKNLFNDYKCKCPTGFSGKDCHIDPHGNVMRRRGDDDTSDNTQKALIATFATIIPALVIIACALILCKNRRYKNEQKKADAEAKRENELNAVTSVNKSKMLDDHMIVNQFECKSKTKRNVNEHQEDFFNSKDVGTYKQMVSPQYVPHSNVNSGVNKKLMNTDYKQHSVAASSFEKLLNDSKDNFSSSGDTYSSTGTCVTSSSSAASSTTSSQYIPESTYSRSLNLTANGRHTHLNVGAAPASQFNDCASTVSSCSSDSNRGGVTATTAGASSMLNTSYNSNTSTKSKKNDLPTAASINSEAASARSTRSPATSSQTGVTNNRQRQHDLRRSIHTQHNHFSDVNDLSTDDLYATEV